MTDRQVNALAAFIADGTSWDTPGIVAELRRQREHYDPWQLAAAMLRRASDPANLTPRLQAFDAAGFVSCARHPGASVRTDGTCGVCFSEAHESDTPATFTRRSPPVEARRLVHASRPVPYPPEGPS